MIYCTASRRLHLTIELFGDCIARGSDQGLQHPLHASWARLVKPLLSVFLARYFLDNARTRTQMNIADTYIRTDSNAAKSSRRERLI